MANDVTIRIGAELSEIKSALAQVQSQLRGVGDQAKKAGGANTFGGMNAGLKQATSLLKGFLASVATIATAGAFIRVADEMATLNARLKIATRSSDEYLRAQVALFDLSQRTRSSLTETIDLYAKIALATKDANVGQETLLQITETINQAVQLSGVSAQAAQAALTQLGQGLASGTLRGEELNSVLEQTPVLADVIAKGMGITRGELRKYGEEGKITSQAVIEALKSQGAVVAEQFRTLPLTVGQATTKIGNSLRTLIASFDEGAGVTGALAQQLSDLADFLGSDQFLGSVREFAKVWGDAIGDVIGDFRDAVRIIGEGTRNMVGDGRNAIDLLSAAFFELPRNLRTVVRSVTIGFAAMVDSFVADARFLRDAVAAIFTDDTIAAALERRNSAVAAAARTAREMIDEEVAANRAALADAKKAGEDLVRQRERARRLRGGTGTGTPGKPTADKNAPTAADYAAAEARLVKDATDRELKAIERLYEDATISAAEYIRRRTELQIQAIDAEIAAEEKKVAAGGKGAVAARANLEILKRQRADAEVEAQRLLTDIQKKADADRVQLQARSLEQQGQTVAATRLRVEAEYRDTLARLRAEGDTEGLDLVQKIIDNEVLSAELSEAESNIDRTLSRLTAGEERLKNAAELGLISQTTAEEQAQALREQSIAILQRQIAEMERLAAASADPAIVDKIEEYKARLAELQAQQTPLLQQTRSIGQSALQGFFTDLATNAKSAGDAVRDLVVNFVQGLGKMAAEVLAKKAIFALLGGGKDGGGGMLGGLFASLFHSGGIVGAGGGVRRYVSPWVFAGAPRYHSGGMVGLAPNEQAAVLLKGEEVLSRTDPRNAANGGGGGYRIVNVIDPSLVGDYMDSASGEKQIMNIIGRNPGRVRQLIGG